MEHKDHRDHRDDTNEEYNSVLRQEGLKRADSGELEVVPEAEPETKRMLLDTIKRRLGGQRELAFGGEVSGVDQEVILKQMHKGMYVVEIYDQEKINDAAGLEDIEESTRRDERLESHYTFIDIKGDIIAAERVRIHDRVESEQLKRDSYGLADNEAVREIKGRILSSKQFEKENGLGPISEDEAQVLITKISSLKSDT